MSATFTSISLQVYISGAWTELWEDVRHDPAPTCSRGIQGNDIEDRVADPGYLKFSLDNSASNSAGLLGRYSPGHANCLTGWTTSLPVRLTFTYDSWSVIKWYGRIETDGITVIPGALGTRRVDVSCVDYMGLAADHKINLLTLATNQYLYQGVTTLLGNMPIQPLATSYYDEAGVSLVVMPAIFDTSNTETTAMGEFQKLAASQRMYIYVTGDGDGETLTTAKIPSAVAPVPVGADRSNKLLLETGDDILLEDGSFLLLDMTENASFDDSDLIDPSISYGKHLYNYLTITTYPRKTDAAATTILWTLESATPIGTGATVTIRGAYTDPAGGASKVNGTAMVTPLSGTDYKANASADGSGVDKTADLGVVATYGAAEVELALTNNAATTIYVGGGTAGAFFQVRGKGVYTYDTLREIFKDTTSMTTHGVHPYTIDLKYQNTPTTVPGKTPFGDSFITNFKNPSYTGDKFRFVANEDSMNMAAFMFLDVRDRVTITESVTGFNSLSGSDSTIIQNYDFEIVNKKAVFWSITTKNSYA